LRRRRPTSALGVLVVGVLLLCVSTLEERVRLIYNPSPSEPIGWYFVRPASTVRPHDIVLAWPPEAAAIVGDDRHYLPHGVPLLKEVGAVGGQFVCLLGDAILIDGATAAHARRRDGAGRELTSWSECRALVEGELFLLGRHSDASFDSRYFGPIRRTAVVGQAIPLWTW